MGDMSAEPSMEDILSSIKRIIAEENDASPARAKKPARPAPRPDPEPERFAHDEILELSEPAPSDPESDAAPYAALRPPAPQTPSNAVAAAPTPLPGAEALISPQAAEASRGPLDALSRLVVKSDAAAGPETLEGLVREMLRPMLREWLDTHLPVMVETMVAREIERITAK